MNTPPAAVPATTLSTKPHYAILDGLRGVAALMVVAFHLCEAHASSHLDQLINHGYLAVDFFFLLSGYVVGYAYDDRWQQMTTGGFFRRRLIRLQPLVVLGMLIGAALFYCQTGPLWPRISQTPGWLVLLVMAINATTLPVPLALDIRGWHEMHPLDGPAWSLFYEYIANMLYALGVRRFSTAALAGLVALAGAALVHYLLTSKGGDIVGGWSLEPEQLRVGFTRMLFPFFAGLLLRRLTRPGRLRNAFGWCSLLLVAVLAWPRVGGAGQLWLNGLYESFSIILLFPLIVWLGASGQVKGAGAGRLCRFMGDLSYPLYITHYPLIYTYTAWVARHKATLPQGLPLMLLTFAASVLLAYVSLKFYDEPLRRWLGRRFLSPAPRPA
jgi:peptidoglycan/LPS O-acetylase OafA/YrhL